MIYYVVVFLMLAVYVVLARRISPHAAMAILVPLTWLFPAWFLLPIAPGPSDSIVGSGVDIKVGVTTGCLILYCFMPGRTFPLRLVWADYAMLVLFLTHIVSDTSNGGLSLFTFGRAYAEWYLPYVAGRICISSRDDLRFAWVVPAALAVLFGFAALAEGLLHFRVFEWFAGVRPLEGASRDVERWGMVRAYGPTMHPIYFGVVQLLLLGWVCYAARQSLIKRCNAIWALSPLPAMLGIFCTASRGPLLGLGVLAFAGLFVYLKRLRLPLAMLLAVGVLAGVWKSNEIIERLERWSGERKRDIVIRGEDREYSSVKSRILTWEINKIALRRSGLLGFGTEAVSGFPINVPLGEMELETFKQAWSVENSYLLLTLRFGYLGLISFAAAAGLSLYQYLRLAECYRDRSVGWLATFVGAAVLAVLVVQLTVWMPHEIGFPLVWHLGLSSGLYLAHLDGKLTRKERN